MRWRPWYVGTVGGCITVLSDAGLWTGKRGVETSVVVGGWIVRYGDGWWLLHIGREHGYLGLWIGMKMCIREST